MKERTFEASKFELLRNKNILEILIGNVDFGDLIVDGKLSDITVSMPYLSGPDLCDISNHFGLPVEYSWGGGAQSRWSYLDDLLKYCIENKCESKLLAFLFSKGQFVNKLKGETPEVIEESYCHIIEAIIKQINGILYFGGNELVKTGDIFVIREIGDNTAVVTPVIKAMNKSYITDVSNRAMKDIADGNYDSAITKSRTLIEEVFCYVIEKKNEMPSSKGDAGELYSQVKQLYNMHHDKEMDRRINELLSGLEKILSSISRMRNENSDSHGVGSKRIKISDHHARLFVNSAMIMAEFILEVSEKT